jgi:hypothetical protein
VAAADVATVTPPFTSAARDSTSTVCAASLTGCLATGATAPAPGAVSSAASATLGEGAWAPTSRGELAPRHSPPPPPPPLPRPTMSTPKSPGERVPGARAAGTLHSSAPGALATGSSSPSCTLGLGAWADRTAPRPRSPTAEDE